MLREFDSRLAGWKDCGRCGDERRRRKIL